VVTGEEMEFTTEGTEGTEKSGSVGATAGGELKLREKSGKKKEEREREREEGKVIAIRV
jgi:hypothetical protein